MSEGVAQPALATRLDSLPLVLAGPIVRHCTTTEATVWVALRKQRTVRLRVQPAAGDPFEGSIGTVPVGTHLHIAAVTARTADALEWGTTCRYDLDFGAAETSLFSPGVLQAAPAEARKALCYANGPDLPSYVLPPPKLTDVRLLHGSCRKPHGGGEDALPTADAIIEAAVAGSGGPRPHQLFLTGDQIYADDVHDGLLALLTDAGDTLLGWPQPEVLTGVGRAASDVPPGTRQERILADGLTSTHGKSHLLALGEFLAMYLFVWSDVLWPGGEPESLAGLESFRRGLPRVRRALANVTTYMMFDDHEISDDWNIHAKWMRANHASLLGRRTVRHGLTAFAVCQAWGNTPDRFESGAGRALLDALPRWRGEPTSESVRASQAIERAVGPYAPQDRQGELRLVHPDGAIDWHYRLSGPAYDVLVLDTRTWRTCTGDDEQAPPALLLPGDVFAAQVDGAPPPGSEVTLVVSPAPVLGMMVVELLQSLAVGSRYSTTVDTEAWGFHAAAFEKLLGRLHTRVAAGADGIRRTRAAVLAGDVHYGFAGRLRYSGAEPFGGMGAGPVEGVVAQLTASSLKNEDGLTMLLHDGGFTKAGLYVQLSEWVGPAQAAPLLAAPLPPPRFERAGWRNTVEARMTVGAIDEQRLLGGPVPWQVQGSPALATWAAGAVEQHGVWRPVKSTALAKKPEWRYEVQLLRHKPADPRKPDLRQVKPPSGMVETLRDTWAPLAENHRTYRDRVLGGSEIVGRANLGELRFQWGPTEEEKAIVQSLWWRREPQDAPRPHTRYVVPLGLQKEVQLTLEVDRQGTRVPLADAWVYRREGGAVTVLRTDADGAALAYGAGVLPLPDPAVPPAPVTPELPPADAPWAYGVPVGVAEGTTLELAFSRGAKPVPQAVLTVRPDLFAAYPFAGKPVAVADGHVELTTPAELSIWPLLWELPPQYSTAGLAGGAQTLEGRPAAPPPAQAAPRERALRVAGRVDAAATEVAVELHDAGGRIALRGAPAGGVAAVVGPPAGGVRPFEATLLLQDAAKALGPVSVVIVTRGGPAPRADAFPVHLCGLQVALVADPAAGKRGAVPRAKDELVVLDFTASPQASDAALLGQSRLRRMVAYDIGVGLRPLPGVATPLPRPQMPLWMGELQLVGLGRPQLEDLLRRRLQRAGTAPPRAPRASLRVELAWRLSLAWDGPDSSSGAFGTSVPNPHLAYREAREWKGTVAAELALDERGRLVDGMGRDLGIAAGGSAPAAWTAAPKPIPFPVAGRRLPSVFVGGRRECWGRAAAATELDALTLEFQPWIVGDQGQEVVRGGDGELDVTVTIDGRPVESPPAGTPRDLRLPTFRVRGRGPGIRQGSTPPPGFTPATDAQVVALIATLVAQRLQANRAKAGEVADFTAILSQAVWTDTVQRILRYECGGRGGYVQFDETTRRAGPFKTMRYGLELGMPLFGPPHGYGIGQLDNWGAAPVRGVNADLAWDFVANLRMVVELVMLDKALAAYRRLKPYLAKPATRRDQAIFRREVVRLYNSAGGEFRALGAPAQLLVAPALQQWETYDGVKLPYRNLLYCNQVLSEKVTLAGGKTAWSGMLTYWIGKAPNAGDNNPKATQADFKFSGSAGIVFGNPKAPSAPHLHYGPLLSGL